MANGKTVGVSPRRVAGEEKNKGRTGGPLPTTIRKVEAMLELSRETFLRDWGIPLMAGTLSNQERDQMEDLTLYRNKSYLAFWQSPGSVREKIVLPETVHAEIGKDSILGRPYEILSNPKDYQHADEVVEALLFHKPIPEPPEFLLQLRFLDPGFHVFLIDSRNRIAVHARFLDFYTMPLDDRWTKLEGLFDAAKKLADENSGCIAIIAADGAWKALQSGEHVERVGAAVSDEFNHVDKNLLVSDVAREQALSYYLGLEPCTPANVIISEELGVARSDIAVYGKFSPTRDLDLPGHPIREAFRDFFLPLKISPGDVKNVAKAAWLDAHLKLKEAMEFNENKMSDYEGRGFAESGALAEFRRRINQDPDQVFDKLFPA